MGIFLLAAVQERVCPWLLAAESAAPESTQPPAPIAGDTTPDEDGDPGLPPLKLGSVLPHTVALRVVKPVSEIRVTLRGDDPGDDPSEHESFPGVESGVAVMFDPGRAGWALGWDVLPLACFLPTAAERVRQLEPASRPGMNRTGPPLA